MMKRFRCARPCVFEARLVVFVDLGQDRHLAPSLSMPRSCMGHSGVRRFGKVFI